MTNIILVVDDSRTIRKIATKILESHGLVTRQAENGEIALNACKEAMPDGILLDWNMPVMDGHTFLTMLRKLPEGAAPKVLFCTTESDIEKISAALSAGADEFIMKPFDEEILISKLELVGLISESRSND
jgi:two-component system chemotaxis response regulator CheY